MANSMVVLLAMQPGDCLTCPAVPASCTMCSSGFPKHPILLLSLQVLQQGNVEERTKPCALRHPSLKREEKVCTTLVLGNVKLHRSSRMSSRLLDLAQN